MRSFGLNVLTMLFTCLHHLQEQSHDPQDTPMIPAIIPPAPPNLRLLNISAKQKGPMEPRSGCTKFKKTPISAVMAIENKYDKGRRCYLVPHRPQ